MRRIARWLQLILVGASLFVAVAPAPALAAGFNVFEGACDSQADSATCNSAVKPNGSNPLTGKDGVLLKVARIVAVIAGFSAIIIIIIAGFSYITAGGDAAKAKKAREALVGALVGLFIIAIASVIITFVVNNSGV
jgi:hypothetical protein